MALSQRIKELREKANMSQKDLAAKIGVTPGAVAHWELGHKKPSLDNVFRLAVAFNLTVAELFSP